MAHLLESEERKIRNTLAERRAFRETPIGRLLLCFESALGKAWCTDQREGASTAAMTRDWSAAGNARDELIAAIKAAEARADALARRLAEAESGAAEAMREAEVKIGEHVEGAGSCVAEVIYLYKGWALVENIYGGVILAKARNLRRAAAFLASPADNAVKECTWRGGDTMCGCPECRIRAAGNAVKEG